ncbi:MAG: redoxin domain-containing protein [Chloroflexota bacterium]|nr:redoxin domain-containing protein [Chloroflexota bacterium]
MFGRANRWLGWMAVVIVLGVAWIALSRVPDATSLQGHAPRAGFIAPDFILRSLSGEEVRLADYRGQGVLLNFWATWCAPCRAEMPAIQQVADAYAEEGLVVLLVNRAEREGAVRGFVEQTGVTAPVLLDPEDVAADAYRIGAMPTTFFIDRSGRIQEVTIGGPMTEAHLQSRIESLVGGP